MTILGIGPTDTLLVAAPRPYGTVFRARVRHPLSVTPSQRGPLVVTHEESRIVIRRDQGLSTRIPADVATAIARRMERPVLYAVEFVDMRLLRKLLTSLVDDAALFVDNAHGLSLPGDEFVRTLVRQDHWEWRNESAPRFRSTAAARAMNEVIDRWLSSKRFDSNLAVHLEWLRDDGFDVLAGLLSGGSLDTARQVAALAGLSRLTRRQCYRRREEFRSIAKDLVERTDDVAVRSRALLMVMVPARLSNAIDDERASHLVRAALERDLDPVARDMALAFLERIDSGNTSRAREVPRDAATLAAFTPEEIALEELEPLLAAQLHDLAGVTIERQTTGKQAIVVTRVVGDVTRVVRITPVEHASGAPWDFALLLSENSKLAPNAGTDGRNGGTRKFTLRLVGLWLADWVSWQALPVE